MSTNLTSHFDAGQLRDIGDKINAAIHDGITNGVKKAVYVGATTAKQGGFKDRTGQLRATIYGILEGWSGKWCWGVIHSPQKYTSYVEFPTRAHEIWPKAPFRARSATMHPGQTRRAAGKGPHEYIVGRGIALRWVSGGTEHFARMVHHPGTVGFFFMRYAEQVAKRELAQSIQAFVRPI